MLCINQEKTYDTEDVRKVVIQADTTPAAFPLTGETVEGLPDGAKIAPGSMMYCVDTGKTYFLNKTGDTWNCWGGNA